MPLIAYKCDCGHAANKFFRRPKEAPPTSKCEKCSGDLKKQLSAPSSTSKIVVDNGVQARAVEVDLDIVKDIEERSTKDFRNK